MTDAHSFDEASTVSPASGSSRMRVVNRTRGTVLAESLQLAGTSAERNRGLLGRDSLAPGEGLWIVPCESVHTFGMRFAIDLIYLDRKHRIRKIRHNVKPWRLSACLVAHSVLELPAGSVRLTESQKGDVLELKEAGVPRTGEELTDSFRPAEQSELESNEVE